MTCQESMLKKKEKRCVKNFPDETAKSPDQNFAVVLHG